jgi:predicted acetyltransferase
MAVLVLIRPTLELRNQIWEYRQEFLDHGETRINGSGGLAKYGQFDEWLEFVTSLEHAQPTNEITPATVYFSMRASDGRLIGSAQLRHELTEELAQHGGHIGYAIRPSERGKGYATEQLRQVLREARKTDLLKVMVTCRKDNIASAKVIINNGGVLTREGPYKDEIIQTYWIDLK